jgi:HD-like signal output (HDOD) protein
MKRILFVDDEAMILEALERSLHPMRHEWEMRFANGATEGLARMAECAADVVVSDMRMPQMNGAQLLNEINKRHPKTVRIILSGFSDMEMIMQCINGTHQFLTKPCSGEVLRNVVGRALELDEWVNNESVKALVARLGKLPTVPSLYFEIIKELDSPRAALEHVSMRIAQDPAMTAKILQLVNSAFFGLRRQLTNPTEAVLQLGLDTIKSLVLGIHVFSDLEMSETAGVSAQELWHHSLATAASSRRIAQWERQEQKFVEDCFTAGLLHDVGRLVLAANLPDQYAQAKRLAKNEAVALVDAEVAVFGASHAEVGAYLLGLWGLPVSLVETAMFHHWPARSKSRSFTPLSVVHVANVHEQPLAHGLDDGSLPKMDDNYLCQIGMFDRAQIWRRLLAPAPILT